jgi:hypothetical protein
LNSTVNPGVNCAEELDVLRAEGTVRRPYAKAPELLEYANLPGLA